MFDVRSLRQTLRLAAEVLLIVFAMKSFAYASHYIPSESMVPTLEVGDRLLVAKWPWGFSRYSLMVDPHASAPTADGRVFSALPARGDVAVFTHPKSGETMIKRVIGLPGDRIALHRGRLFINGELVKRTPRETYAYREYKGGVVEVTRYDETLPGGRTHAIIERSDSGFADAMDEIVVPANHLFMMGDNRDNSADSRFAQMGVVPVENLQGRADLIGWTLYGCAEEPGLKCGDRRFLSAIE